MLLVRDLYWLILESTNKDLLPITSKDIIAGYMVRHLLFYGFESYITELFEEKRARPISIKTEENRLNETLQPEGVVIENLPVGSNAFDPTGRFSMTTPSGCKVSFNRFSSVFILIGRARFSSKSSVM